MINYYLSLRRHKSRHQKHEVLKKVLTSKNDYDIF